jgi:hypothetical protein
MTPSTKHNPTVDIPLADDFGSTEYLSDYAEAIAEIAYYKAENRGFEAGHDVDDWLEAERELLLDK